MIRVNRGRRVYVHGQSKVKIRHPSQLIVSNIIRVMMLAPYFMAILIALWFYKNLDNDKS